MAYTVKQVAAISGVSIRTLHFYDETGLLKPASVGTNGYRFYEEPQLLALQQILFYRELGFELKQIKSILDRADFEKIAALQSHRQVLEQDLARTRALIQTIDRTIQHLKGTRKMDTQDMFAGFSLAAGKARFDEQIKLGGEPNDCKLSAQDTDGALCVFEFTGSGSGPRHRHNEQDEWIYIIDGEFDFHVGAERFVAGPGQSVFIPRRTPHDWAAVNRKPGKVINTYQPAGKMEAFFRRVGSYSGARQIHDALSIDEMRALFHEHGMDLLGPPPVGEWKVDENRRIVRTA